MGNPVNILDTGRLLYAAILLTRLQIILNPPYQEDRQGESTTALPIYHQFMDAAFEIGDKVELITPARFLFNAGRTPKEWNQKMLNDEHFKVLLYEPDGSKVFSNTDIKGGVVISYRDSTKTGEAIGTFTIYPMLNQILKKVKTHSETNSLASICFVASKFSIEELSRDFPEYTGHERRMSSNVLSFSCFHDEKEDDDVMIYGVERSKRCEKYITRRYVDLTDTNIEKYKIVIPKADGSGKFGDQITNPIILPPASGFTHTFLGIGGFDSEAEANNALSYIKTKFARTLLGVLKVTQDVNAEKWKYVPLQNFTSASDVNWTKTISEIDQQLYRKYDLSQEEIDFIESHVKEMN